MTQAEYITNLNADDRLSKNALEIMASVLNQYPDAALVYADSYITSVPNETFEKNSSQQLLQ